MKGAFSVNGVSSTTFGVYVVDGGYNGLLSYPSMKQPQTTDWAERDGIEVDLTNPKLAASEFSIDFYSESAIGLFDFMNCIVSQMYNSFWFDDLEMAFDLRVIAVNDFSTEKMRKFNVGFQNDNPAFLPIGSPVSLSAITGYKLDNVDISYYGVNLIKGSNDEILKPAPIKENLSINPNHINGLIYDDGIIKRKEKEVSLKCFIRTDSVFDFWRNYNSFLLALVGPGLRLFEYNGVSYQCFYRSSNVVRFSIGATVWCEFNVNLIFTK